LVKFYTNHIKFHILIMICEGPKSRNCAVGPQMDLRHCQCVATDLSVVFRSIFQMVGFLGGQPAPGGLGALAYKLP